MMPPKRSSLSRKTPTARRQSEARRNETEDQHQARLQAARLRMSTSREAETEDQHQKHLQEARLRMATLRGTRATARRVAMTKEERGEEQNQKYLHQLLGSPLSMIPEIKYEDRNCENEDIDKFEELPLKSEEIELKIENQYQDNEHFCDIKMQDDVVAHTVNLRNYKFKMKPLLDLKLDEINLQIEEADLAIEDFNEITDIKMESHAGCSNSNDQVTENVYVQVEDGERKENIVISDLPLTYLQEETYACDHCSFSCLFEEEYKKHVANHYIEKPFSCELCFYITKYKGALKNHSLTHSKGKRFSCEYCAFQTSYKGNLKTHMQIHLGEKQFSCKCCSFRTNCKKQYDVHMLSHTGEKSFFCDYCSFKTRKNDDFRSHILTHRQPFKCCLCLYETSSFNLLSSHMLTCCVLIRPKKLRAAPIE